MLGAPDTASPKKISAPLPLTDGHLLATVNLLSQLKVGLRDVVVAVVVEDRQARRRRLLDLHAVLDDDVEDLAWEGSAQFVQDLAGVCRAPVEHRRQDAGDPEVA